MLPPDGNFDPGLLTPASTNPPTPTTPGASACRYHHHHRRLGHGAGMGTGMLEGSGASLFPFNNDGVMVEARGASSVAASNLRPSELPAS